MSGCYLMDCRELLKTYEYDYVFCGPFDFSEVGMEPTEKGIKDYLQIMREVFELFKPKNNVVTLSFTDRKYNNRIIPKSYYYKNIMFDLGWELHSHKIWKKSDKMNLYRLNYSNVLSFCKVSKNQKVKQNLKYRPFKYDIWFEEDDKFKGFKMGFPINIVRRCIRNYTKEGDVVVDPFMGSGTTAIASMIENRNYLGSEINEDYFQLCNQRISEFNPNDYEDLEEKIEKMRMEQKK